MSDDKKVDFEVFDGKNVSDVFKDIYENSVDTKNSIESVINTLSPLIKNVNDAAILAPVVKEFLDVKVKNNEHLIKLTDVVQKVMKIVHSAENGSSDGYEGLFDEKELRELFDNSEQVKDDVDQKSRDSIGLKGDDKK